MSVETTDLDAILGHPQGAGRIAKPLSAGEFLSLEQVSLTGKVDVVVAIGDVDAADALKAWAVKPLVLHVFLEPGSAM